LPPDKRLCPWTPLGAPPPDLLIGSRSMLAMCPPTFKLLPPPLDVAAAEIWYCPGIAVTELNWFHARLALLSFIIVT